MQGVNQSHTTNRCLLGGTPSSRRIAMSQSTEENRLCLDPILEELRAWKKFIEVKANTPREIGRTALSQRWQAMATAAILATAARRRMPVLTTRRGWQWTRPVTCLSPRGTTSF